MAAMQASQFPVASGMTGLPGDMSSAAGARPASVRRSVRSGDSGHAPNALAFADHLTSHHASRNANANFGSVLDLQSLAAHGTFSSASNFWPCASLTRIWNKR